MKIQDITLKWRFYLFGNPESKEHTHIPGYREASLIREIQWEICLQLGNVLEWKKVQQIEYWLGRAIIYVWPDKNPLEEKYTLYEANQYDGQSGKPKK